jgi:hypothetical protein
MKHKVKDKQDKLELQVEALSFADMNVEFSSDLLKQFKKRKGHFEDWQSEDENIIDNMKSRLRVLADLNNYKTDDLLDMALLCSYLWNNK